MWVTYGWHTSTYEWHTDDLRVHANDLRVTYEYIRVTYGWHTSTYCFGFFTKIKKGSGISFWCTFSAWVFHTNGIYLILYQLTKFQRHIFIQDIKQNMLFSFIYTIDDVINFKIYLQSYSKKMTEEGGIRGSRKYKNVSISRTERTF